MTVLFNWIWFIFRKKDSVFRS